MMWTAIFLGEDGKCYGRLFLMNEDGEYDRQRFFPIKMTNVMDGHFAHKDGEYDRRLLFRFDGEYIVFCKMYFFNTMAKLMDNCYNTGDHKNKLNEKKLFEAI